jgi:hypothetical protein
VKLFPVLKLFQNLKLFPVLKLFWKSLDHLNWKEVVSCIYSSFSINNPLNIDRNFLRLYLLIFISSLFSVNGFPPVVSIRYSLVLCFLLEVFKLETLMDCIFRFKMLYKNPHHVCILPAIFALELWSKETFPSSVFTILYL